MWRTRDVCAEAAEPREYGVCVGWRGGEAGGRCGSALIFPSCSRFCLVTRWEEVKIACKGTIFPGFARGEFGVIPSPLPQLPDPCLVELWE